MKTVEEARTKILEMVSPLAHEQVMLHEAHGRVLASPVVSKDSVPPFDSSAMDGFAVRAEDLAHATAQHPVMLSVVDEVAAGRCSEVSVGKHQAVRIMTGAPIPLGADAVIRIEDTSAVHAQSGEGHCGQQISCFTSVAAGESVRRAGMEFEAHQEVLATHDLLDAPALALAAMAGCSELTVFKRPVVGIASTGDELVAPGEDLKMGQIRDANTPMLVSLVCAAGGIPRVYPSIPDSLEHTKQFFAQASAECDVILTTGGVSMGEFDFIKPAIEALGTLQMWRVAMKPGKPQTIGSIIRPLVAHERDSKEAEVSPVQPDVSSLDDGCHLHPFVQQEADAASSVMKTLHDNEHVDKDLCLVFGLPGNPSSAYVGFELFVRPMLRKMQGHRALVRPSVYARLRQAVDKADARRFYLRGRLEPHEDTSVELAADADLIATMHHRSPVHSYDVDVSMRQTSQLISAAHHGDVLVMLADGVRSYQAGDLVLCIRIDLPEEAC